MTGVFFVDVLLLDPTNLIRLLSLRHVLCCLYHLFYGWKVTANLKVSFRIFT